MLSIPSPLTEEQETLVESTIGRCIHVHTALGPGLLEHIYSRAIALELTAAGIHFEREKTYPVTYRGELLCQPRLDFCGREHSCAGDQVHRGYSRCPSRAIAQLPAHLKAACRTADEL